MHNHKFFPPRYMVKAVDDHLATLQMMTSKSDVYVKLQVLDHEEELVSAVGKGHVVLPAFVFQKNEKCADEEKRPASVLCEWISCVSIF